MKRHIFLAEQWNHMIVFVIDDRKQFGLSFYAYFIILDGSIFNVFERWRLEFLRRYIIILFFKSHSIAYCFYRTQCTEIVKIQ